MVVPNEKSDYAGMLSKNLSLESAKKRRLMVESTSAHAADCETPRLAARKHMALSGILNRLHIDSVALQKNASGLFKSDRNKESNNNEEDNLNLRKPGQKGNHHHHHAVRHKYEYQYQYQRGKRSPPTPSEIEMKQSRLVPTARRATKSRRTDDRVSDSRLRGADLYVARLCMKTVSTVATRNIDAVKAGAALNMHKKTESRASGMPDPADITSPIEIEARNALSSTSLHDELSCLDRPSASQTTIGIANNISHNLEVPSPVASRPCYRCIAYMYRAGIRRVFWSTSTGVWEGGKVRDFVDMMEAPQNIGDDPAASTTASGAGLFVTKHEVLLLRRTMGDKLNC